MIAYLFLFHVVYWSFILDQGWLLSNNFCKACQNCLHPIFVRVRKAVRMHQLLLCCESSRKCHHAAQTTPTWTKPILTSFTKLIAVQPSMAEYEWTIPNYAIMHWSQFCYISFKSWQIWSQTRVSLFFFFYSHCIMCKDG